MEHDRLILSGKRALVTGATGLIGSWIARALVDAGCSLCLTDREPDALNAAAAAMPWAADSFIHPANLACDSDIHSLIAAVANHWQAPDIVINNAGVYPLSPLLETTSATFDRIIDVNLRAPFLLTQGFARQMITESVAGVFVNLSSAAARKPRRGFVPYCASKAALDSLTRGTALELAKFGIRVNALEPGFVGGSDANVLPDDYIKRHSARVPLGRVSRSSDIGEAVLYLASGRSAHVTGTVLVVDGGSTLGDEEADK